VAKAAILSAVPPLMVQTAANPGGLPKEVFDGLQAQLAASRTNFYRELAAGPFMAYNRPGRQTLGGRHRELVASEHDGRRQAHYDGIVAFSQTDFTEDLKKITVPVLVMHGDDDQIVPYADSGPLSAKAFEERHAEDLQGLSARHADHGSRHHQCRPARVHQIMKVILFGATGMVGQGVLRECLVDAGVTEVLAVGRRPDRGAARQAA
jgi:pimeloyl-ACP methyl ester carboxylesterase